MPQQSEAQIIGREGEIWFESQLPSGWVLQPPKTDVGIDGVVVICDSSDLNGREFRVQVKSSKSPKVIDSNIVVSGIKHSTIEYWFLSPLPTLIVAYNVTEKIGYYRWHVDIFDEVREPLKVRNEKTISIYVSTNNTLNAGAWETIKEDLRWHYRNLSESLYTARNAKSLLPTIHDLAAAVRQLNSIDHQPIPIDRRTAQQEGILAIMEMMQHRLIVTSLSQLLSELDRDSEGTRILGAWIASYSSRVSSVFPNFEKLESWERMPPDFHIVYDRSSIHSNRSKLMELTLEMLMLLAPGRFNRADDKKSSHDGKYGDE